MNSKILFTTVFLSVTSAMFGSDKFFELNIRPVLAEKCYSCHGEKKQDAAVRLDSGEAFAKVDLKVLQNTLKNGNAHHKISEKEYVSFGRWIKDGAVWPAPIVVKTTHIQPEDRNYWAYVPVKEPKLPQIADNTWSDHPIDTFVLRKLKENGLTPAEP
ncbi:MAG: hypothetical protein NE327_07725, partial [Lentisphaeraceae bacterium]|nr:hypothetical protein [Lentisphaeraceae bacterium]